MGIPDAERDTERLLHLGHEDNVHYSGRPLHDRLRRLFDVEELAAREPEVSRFSLQRGEKISLSKKIARDLAVSTS